MFRGAAARARAQVEASGGRVCFVRLVVSESEQERRISNEDRKRFHKWMDLSTLRRLRSYRGGVEQPPVDLEVDTDTSTAEKSAALIVEHFQLMPEEKTQRYPQRE